MTRLALLVTLLLASPAAAAPTLILCAFDSQQGGGWISPVIQIAHDAATGAVEVLDPIVMRHSGTAVRGAARADGSGSTTYRWLLTNFRTDNGILVARLSYQVTLRHADGVAMGRMRPAGDRYVGTFSAPGRCQRQG